MSETPPRRRPSAARTLRHHETKRPVRREGRARARTREILSLGENIHVTRIDPKTDYWEAIASTDAPDGEFPPGLALDFDTTYCRRVVEQGSSIALHDATERAQRIQTDGG